MSANALVTSSSSRLGWQAAMLLGKPGKLGKPARRTVTKDTDVENGNYSSGGERFDKG